MLWMWLVLLGVEFVPELALGRQHLSFWPVPAARYLCGLGHSAVVAVLAELVMLVLVVSWTQTLRRLATTC